MKFIEALMDNARRELEAENATLRAQLAAAVGENERQRQELDYLHQHPQDVFIRNMALQNKADQMRAALEALIGVCEGTLECLRMVYSLEFLTGGSWNMKLAITKLVRAIYAAKRQAALRGGETVCPDCDDSGYVPDGRGGGEACGCNAEGRRGGE